MDDLFLTILNQYGLAAGGVIAIVTALSMVVRALWRDAQKDQASYVLDLKQQFVERLADKNAELSQVWSELRSERDEKRREQASKEGFERLLQRQMDLTKAAQEDGASWRSLVKKG